MLLGGVGPWQCMPSCLDTHYPFAVGKDVLYMYIRAGRKVINF